MLQRAEKQSLADNVLQQLMAEIVGGSYRAGSEVPSERELSEMLGVNRHVVREALQRLQQLGLVKVTQGGRTKVLDFHKSAGLDLLAVVAERSDPATVLPLLAPAMEMRAGIGADVARLCAQRASRRTRDELVAIAAELAEISQGTELLGVDELFWQRALEGAGNLAYQLAFNSLMRASHAHPEVSVPWLERELARSDYRRPLAAAIAARDADAAAATARAALALAGDGDAGGAPRRRGARR